MPYIPYTTQYVIGWRNVFYGGTLTASSEPDGGEPENAVDGFTSDYWAPVAGASPAEAWIAVDCGSTTAVDYLAIAAHNLGTIGAEVTLEGSADGSSWTTVTGPHAVADDTPAMWIFVSVSYRHYRLVIAGDAISLGVLQAGARLTLPEGVFVGYEPERLNRQNDTMNQLTEGGQFIGRSIIRTSVKGEINQPRANQAWVRGAWTLFRDHAELRPFFIMWRSDDYPDEVAYCWSTDDAAVKQRSNGFMDVSMKFAGLV